MSERTAVDLPAERDWLAEVDPSQPITNLRHGVVLCDVLSRSDMVPRGMQGKAANIFVVVMAGQQIGLPWPVALREIFSPGPGQVGMRGELLLSKLHEAGHEYDWDEVPGQSCTFTLERYANDPARQTRKYSATFTIEDALDAGLVKRKDDGSLVALSRDGKPMPWMAYQPDMLFWRAVSRCVKRGAPEVLMGFEIAGAVDGREPEPEVELKPASAVQPPTKEELNEAAAEAIREAGRATEEQLRVLDERMRHESSDETIRAAGIDPLTLRVDWVEDPEVTEATARVAEAVEAGLAEHIEQDEPPADKAKGEVLAERFQALGWHPRAHRADLVRACSMYLRRPITGSRDMSTAEVMDLTRELSGIQRDHPAEQHPVALADTVEVWAEKWREADPEGYEEYAR